MATYAFRCSVCGTDTERDYPIGTARRMTRCPCGRPARLVIGEGVNISAEATPTSRGNVVALNQRDANLARDGAAYRRMRRRGLQPEHIDGAADLENKVGTQDEIDYARAFKIMEQTGGGGKERLLDVVSSIETTHGDPVSV